MCGEDCGEVNYAVPGQPTKADTEETTDIF